MNTYYMLIFQLVYISFWWWHGERLSCFETGSFPRTKFEFSKRPDGRWASNERATVVSVGQSGSWTCALHESFMNTYDDSLPDQFFSHLCIRFNSQHFRRYTVNKATDHFSLRTSPAVRVNTTNFVTGKAKVLSKNVLYISVSMAGAKKRVIKCFMGSSSLFLWHHTLHRAIFMFTMPVY